ncbi:MAG: hypothetical protein R6V58_14600 [Planctomycetota bacterium]
MKKIGPTVLALLPLVLLAGAGCKGPTLRDRYDDSAEIFRLNVGLGPGLLANAHVSRAVALGLGTYQARRYGFRNGHGWIWDERRYDTNLVLPIWGWEDVDATYYGSMPVSLIHGDDKDPLRPGEEPGRWKWARNPLTINNPNRGWGEISANLHLVFIGLDAGIDFGELADYLLGWFGVDIMGDDSRTGAEGIDVERHDPPPRPPPPGPHTDILW